MSEVTTPTNYHDFRKLFLDEVQKKGLQLQSIQHRGLSPQGRPLFTDLAHTVMNPNLPTILHISGCHGIEGYLGSAVQTDILASLDIASIQKVNLVFVHALNPWGMSWYRRVNAHNVDLNRNFFPEGEPRPSNIEFDLFAPLFEKRPQIKKWKIWKAIILNLIKKGFQHTSTTIARGQYHLPESLFYGGSQLEPEITEFLRVVKPILGGCKKIYVLDVHTGLGKFGSENLLLDGFHSEEESDFWRDTLLGTVIDTRTAKGFYPAEGTLSLALRHSFKDKQIFYVFEEFGTRPMITVFFQLVKEHKSFLKLKMDRLRSFEMIATFYPYHKGWRPLITSKGKESFTRLLKKLSRI